LFTTHTSPETLLQTESLSPKGATETSNVICIIAADVCR
jgi:hypothetical protein